MRDVSNHCENKEQTCSYCNRHCLEPSYDERFCTRSVNQILLATLKFSFFPAELFRDLMIQGLQGRVGAGLWGQPARTGRISGSRISIRHPFVLQDKRISSGVASCLPINLVWHG
jgi:hypothetical protein